MAVRAPGAVTRDTVTVAEVQRVALPGSRLAGGSGGVLHRVTWATSLRSRPPAFEPRGGGEFVLASSAALEGLRQVDAGLTLERILEGLQQAGAAALAVTGPIPQRARTMANQLSLPLIEAPEALSLLDAERGIIALVLDRHNELQARASDFYRRLAQLAVEGRGVDAIIEEAALVTSRIVTFEDASFRLRTVAVPPEHSVARLDGAGLSSVEERSLLAQHIRAHPVSATTPTTVLLPAARLGLHRWCAPVVAAQRVAGFVSFCGVEEALTEFDQLTASRASAICALELSKEEAVLAAGQRVHRDLVEELLSPSADSELLQRKAVQAGLGETGPFAVGVFAAGSAVSGAAGGASDFSESLPFPGPAAGSELLLAAADILSQRHRRGDVRCIGSIDGAELTVICDLFPVRGKGHDPVGAGRDGMSGEGAGEARLRVVAADLFASVVGDPVEGSLSAGFSRPRARLQELSRAAQEARDALRIGQRVYDAGRLVCFADLGLYKVLHVLRDSAELRTFHQQTLGPLAEYDRKTGQNLIETLEAYFESHGNLSQTAVKLHHHRNSLLYRIGRIQEISGLDLEDPESRLSLQVALKARRLLS